MQKTKAIAACAAGVLLAGALSGCGANLDREVSVQGMSVHVPSNWVEHVENGGTATNGDAGGASADADKNAAAIDSSSTTAPAFTFSYTENNDKAKDDATPNRIVIACTPLADAPAKTAAEAIAAKQAKLEREAGVTAWDIEKETTEIIDGATAATYRYRFVKEIDGVRQAYDASVVYVVTADAFYEIAVRGDVADINGIVDSIEF